MRLVAAPFHVAAALLVLGGMVKLRAPRTVMPMLAIVSERVGTELPVARRWPAPSRAGRALGVIEVLVGLGCLLGSRIVALVAVVAYALYTELLMAARGRGVEASGYSTAGTAATLLPTVPHIISSMLASIVMFVAALGSDVPSLWDVLGSGPLVAMPHLLMVAIGVAVVIRLATPRTGRELRPLRSPSSPSSEGDSPSSEGDAPSSESLGVQGRTNTEHWSDSRR